MRWIKGRRFNPNICNTRVVLVRMKRIRTQIVSGSGHEPNEHLRVHSHFHEENGKEEHKGKNNELGKDLFVW